MTVKQFQEMLATSREKVFYFWKYQTEQRRHTGTSLSPKTIRASMKRGNQGKYN